MSTITYKTSTQDGPIIEEDNKQTSDSKNLIDIDAHGKYISINKYCEGHHEDSCDENGKLLSF